MVKQYLGYAVWGMLALPMVGLVLLSYLLAPMIACQSAPKLQTIPKLAPPAAWAMTPPPTQAQIDLWTCQALQLSNCPNPQGK